MKSHWFLTPSPYKTSGSINSIVYENFVRAQTVADRPLTRQELSNLIKRMKDKKLFESAQDSFAILGGFLNEMKKHKLMVENKPVAGATTPAKASTTKAPKAAKA